MANTFVEPLLDPKNRKFTMFPIQHRNLWKMYKDQVDLFWTVEEIDISHDGDDFNRLEPDEKYFIEMVLAFFAASDGIVNANLAERFTREVQITEALTCYQFQEMMENIHGEMYSMMLDNIVKDNDRKQFLFNAITNIPVVKNMADWSFKWIESSDSFAHRLVAFACVEGIFFSGAFASIYWLKLLKRDTKTSSGKPFMNGLVASNHAIAKDEGMHCMFACELYRMLVNKLDASVVNTIVKEAVELAKDFAVSALRIRMIGMNSDLMCQYIEYIGDRLTEMLGYTKIYNTANPLRFMDAIGLDNKTNFHETRPTEYPSSNNITDSGRQTIELQEEF